MDCVRNDNFLARGNAPPTFDFEMGYKHGAGVWNSAGFPDAAAWHELAKPPAVAFEDKLDSIFMLQSDCNEWRMAYYWRLREAYAMDSYGRCLNNKPVIPRGDNGHTLVLEACSRYKFYAAFENSICQDYRTEKSFRALECGAIPVVYSPGDITNYGRRLPAGSYLNAADYDTPEDFAKELRRIAGDKELYNRYMSTRYLSAEERELIRQETSDLPSASRACQIVAVVQTGDALKAKRSGGGVGRMRCHNDLPATCVAPPVIESKWKTEQEHLAGKTLFGKDPAKSLEKHLEEMMNG